jgi:hypothetical protein
MPSVCSSDLFIVVIVFNYSMGAATGSLFFFTIGEYL